MNCIKCGRELRGEAVFCSQCKEEMEHYPVKPGTPVQLPVRTETSEPTPKPRRQRKALPPEKQIRHLRKSVRLLLLALIVAVLAFILTSLLTLHLLEQRDRQVPMGQNYRVIEQN